MPHRRRLTSTEIGRLADAVHTRVPRVLDVGRLAGTALQVLASVDLLVFLGATAVLVWALVSRPPQLITLNGGYFDVEIGLAAEGLPSGSTEASSDASASSPPSLGGARSSAALAFVAAMGQDFDCDTSSLTIFVEDPSNTTVDLALATSDPLCESWAGDLDAACRDGAVWVDWNPRPIWLRSDSPMSIYGSFASPDRVTIRRNRSTNFDGEPLHWTSATAEWVDPGGGVHPEIVVHASRGSDVIAWPPAPQEMRLSLNRDEEIPDDRPYYRSTRQIQKTATTTLLYWIDEELTPPSGFWWQPLRKYVIFQDNDNADSRSLPGGGSSGAAPRGQTIKLDFGTDAEPALRFFGSSVRFRMTEGFLTIGGKKHVASWPDDISVDFARPVEIRFLEGEVELPASLATSVTLNRSHQLVMRRIDVWPAIARDMLVAVLGASIAIAVCLFPAALRTRLPRRR